MVMWIGSHGRSNQNLLVNVMQARQWVLEQTMHQALACCQISQTVKSVFEPDDQCDRPPAALKEENVAWQHPVGGAEKKLCCQIKLVTLSRAAADMHLHGRQMGMSCCQLNWISCSWTGYKILFNPMTQCLWGKYQYVTAMKNMSGVLVKKILMLRETCVTAVLRRTEDNIKCSKQ